VVYRDNIGRIAGAYASPDYSFDDVVFYYDSANLILALGLTISVKSKSLSWMSSPVNRRRVTLTSSIAFRKTN
jgi:hypothetical protein